MQGVIGLPIYVLFPSNMRAQGHLNMKGNVILFFSHGVLCIHLV